MRFAVPFFLYFIASISSFCFSQSINGNTYEVIYISGEISVELSVSFTQITPKNPVYVANFTYRYHTINAKNEPLQINRSTSFAQLCDGKLNLENDTLKLNCETTNAFIHNDSLVLTNMDLLAFRPTLATKLYLNLFDEVELLDFSDIEIEEYKPDTDTIDSEESDDICDFCYTRAEFPGGQTAMIHFIENNLSYPDSVPEMKGTVYVRVVIEKDGSLSNFEILRGLSEVYNQEAIRVLSIMPRWYPGANGCGINVRQYENIPVKFK